MGYRVGIDVGGTFTDFVAADDSGDFVVAKVPSTQPDATVGIFQGLSEIAEHFALGSEALLGQTSSIVHGTTVATNTMLQYRGANAGLITTKGFRDLIEIRRNYKESHFDIHLPAPYPIVPRQKRLGVSERVDYSGTVVMPLDENEVREAVRKLKGLEVSAIAVCFLFSYVNPAHESKVQEIIREEFPEAFVSLSSQVLPQVREFERLSTTLVNAYVSPGLQAYLENLRVRLNEKGFRGELFIMQSNGGVVDSLYAGGNGVQSLLSGPAAGVVAGAFLGGLSGYSDIITADMGGTSYDVCLIRNSQPQIGTDAWISRYRVATPMIDIHTIGAGGGSVGWIDKGGALRVGPKSAGADPGPACYGRGGDEPTITDADLVLGYLNPGFFLGGKMPLDIRAAEKAIESRIAGPLGMTTTEAARAMFLIANNAMTNSIRYVSIARGYDPRDFALMAFGGAGPVHAGMQVEDLGIRTIMVPKSASVFCAVGDVISDLKISKVQSYVRRPKDLDVEELNQVFSRMYAEAEALLGDKTTLKGIAANRFIDIRYVGQTHEVTTPIRARTRRITELNLATTFQDFHELHEQLYSFKRPDQPIEVLTLRLDLIGMREKPGLRALAFESEDASRALKERRNVYFEQVKGYIETPIYDGRLVRPGNLIQGPAVIEEVDTTIVVYPGQEAMLDQYQTYVIEVHLARAAS